MPNIVPVDEVPELTREAKASKVLDEFMESGLPLAMVEGNPEGNNQEKIGKTFAGRLKKAINERKLPVEVFNRGGTPYLRRTDIEAPAPAEATT